MTIRRGEQWGEVVDRPADLIVAASDKELARHVAERVERPLGVSSGDLFRTVGAPARRAQAVRLPIDVLRVDADGQTHLAVAHVVARRSWWRHEIVAAVNVDHVGDWNVAPRAHPNDGRFDVVEVDRAMTIRQRLQARCSPEAGHARSAPEDHHSNGHRIDLGLRSAARVVARWKTCRVGAPVEYHHRARRLRDSRLSAGRGDGPSVTGDCLLRCLP